MSEYSNNDWRNYKSDELYHYGVKGQKWGIRRYQNSDGSLTSEGKEHYRRSAGGDSPKARKVFQNVENEKTLKGKIEALYADCKPSYYFDLDEPIAAKRKRESDTAEFGLKVMSKFRPGEDYTPNDINKDWFYNEDQTMGYAMIVDLVKNNGYSAKDCARLIDTAKELDKRKRAGEDPTIDTVDYEDFDNINIPRAEWEIECGYQLKEFAEACEKELRGQRTKR